MKTFFIVPALLSAVVLLAADVPDFALNRIFSNHMVLQRDREIPISGTAAPGEEVTVTLAGQNVTTVAGENGDWTAKFPPMAAGGPWTLTATADDRKIELCDILVGEVWLCSGQSNMEMPLYSTRPEWRAANAEAELAAANHPQLRLFNAASRPQLAPGVPCEEPRGPEWVVCTPEAIGSFSALGYFFGRDLQQKLGVPVGIINASRGGSTIKAWLPESGLRRAGLTGECESIAGAAEARRALDAGDEEALAAIRARFREWLKRFLASGGDRTTYALKKYALPDFDDSKWEKSSIPGNVPGHIDCVYWYRRKLELPADWAGRELTVSLGRIDEYDEVFFNGEKIGETNDFTPGFYKLNRVYKIPGRLVRAGDNLLAVRLVDTAGPGGFYGKSDIFSLYPTGRPEQKIPLAGGGWLRKEEFRLDTATVGVRPISPDDFQLLTPNHNFPGCLYNGMIHPWRRFPIRGFLWYQGESDAGDPRTYLKLHRLLIDEWRKAWNDDQLPFILVQLSAFERQSSPQTGMLSRDFWRGKGPRLEGSWSGLREVQTALLQVPHTGLVVSIDVGDPNDIHPRDKQTLGARAAATAEVLAYGGEGPGGGPIFSGMKKDGSTLRLSFTGTGSGLVAADDKLEGFAIAGADGKFVWADAVIDGDTVVVSAPGISSPEVVAYGWGNYPGNPNLRNREGFPASPFRSNPPDYLTE